MGKVLSKSAAGGVKGIDALRFIIWYIKLSVPYKFSVWFLYLALRLIYVWIRSLWWLFRGVAYRRWQNENEKNFDRSAHVQNIVFRYKMDPVLETSEEHNFITTHHSFQHPQYVLQDNVTLYTASPNGAFFIETDPDIDVTSSDVASFMRVAQFKHAKKLIYLPLESFHKIADLIGRPKGKITFVNNTARCGSTVLVQMFEQAELCRCLSENDALNMISYHDRRHPKKVILRIFESVVRLLCKPHKGIEYESYILKTTAPGIFLTGMMREQFPDSKILFMYRNGIKVADSLSKACIQMPVLRAGYLIFSKVNSFFYFQKMLAEYLCNFPVHPQKKFPTVYCCCFFTWAAIIRVYLDCRLNGHDIVGVKYEHLITNPIENMEIILKHCGLPSEWAEKSLQALEKDSQRNSPLSMKHLNRLEVFAEKFDMKKHKIVVDMMCRWANVEYDAPADYVAEGTITVPVKEDPKSTKKGLNRKVSITQNDVDIDRTVFLNGVSNTQIQCNENEKQA